MDQPQMTKQTLAIIAAILDDFDPTRQWYGLELMRASELKSGTVYPALARLEKAGWLESSWEEIDPSKAKRPLRRLYKLTARGYAQGIEELDRVFTQLQARWRQRPAPVFHPSARPT